MGDSYSFIANSGWMAILCGIVIIFVMVQSALFFRAAWRRSEELGIDKEARKKIVKSSAVFSIVPSLPILISYVILMSALGRFFPWLRLSVIGSATYETMSANMAVTAAGYDSISSGNFTPDTYVMIMWAVTLGIMLSSLAVLILKRYDKKMQSLSSNNKRLGTMITSVMFLGMMATFSAPYIVDYKNITALVTIIVSAGSMFLLDKASKKWKPLKEFSFAISMVAGMASACIASNVIGGI